MSALDGRSNAKKTNEVMSIKFPQVACVHGTEHDMLLLFDDVLELEEFGMLMKFCNNLRNYFGSACHAAVAILKKHNKHNDNDVLLSFIKISETHMGGKIITLLRLIRLRDPLVVTIHSK